MYHELCDDDAEFLDDLIGEADPTKTSSERRDDVIAKLELVWQADGGDRSIVGRILWWAVQRPVLERINIADRAERVAVKVGDRLTTMPKSYAFKPVNPRTGEFRGSIQLVMVEVTWGQFFDKLREMEVQHATVGERIETFREISKLHDKYPQAVTPREACVMEGIDPDVLLDFGT